MCRNWQRTESLWLVCYPLIYSYYTKSFAGPPRWCHPRSLRRPFSAVLSSDYMTEEAVKPPQSSDTSSSYNWPSLLFLRLQLELRSVSALCSSCRINKSCLLNSSLVALSLTFIALLGLCVLGAERPIHLRISQPGLCFLMLFYLLSSPTQEFLSTSSHLSPPLLFFALSISLLFSSPLSTFHCS